MNRPGQWAVATGTLLAAGVLGGVIVSVLDADEGFPVCSATEVAARGLPSVVTIQAQGAAGAGTESGEVIRSDGYVLTNDHMVAPTTRTLDRIHTGPSAAEKEKP